MAKCDIHVVQELQRLDTGKNVEIIYNYYNWSSFLQM